MSKDSIMESTRTAAYMKFGASALVYAIIEYYRTAYGVDSRKILRAIVTDFAQKDNVKFDRKDFMLFVRKQIQTRFKDHDWILESLERDLEYFLNDRPTPDASVLQNSTAPVGELLPLDVRSKATTRDPSSPQPRPAKDAVRQLKEEARTARKKKAGRRR